MKTRIVTALAALLCLAARADGPEEGGDEGGISLLAAQRVQIQSDTRTERGWRRDVVMVDGEGQIKGDGGVVGEKASTDAINAVAEEAHRISDAAKASMNASLTRLYANTNGMARNCVQIAFQVAPETDRETLTGYVVKTETVGGVDRQWVWYNKELSLKPNRFVCYSKMGEENLVKANWVNWSDKGESVTVGGRTWEGCHLCTVERPAIARGQTCLDLPNETWGGRGGIDWGDMLLTDGSKAYYTGFVTNGVTGAVLYFDNGALKPTPNGEAR